MKNDYLYAVAAIRANEVSLLKDADLQQLISVPDYKKAALLLTDKGYGSAEGTNYSKMLDAEIEKTWNLVFSSAKDAEALNLFIVKNDFQNLKAVLKAEISGQKAEDYFVTPSVMEGAKLSELIADRKFDELPDFLRLGAKKAYEVLTKTKNGQFCDITADFYTMQCILDLAKKSNDLILLDFAQSFIVATNIKTAYRAIKTGKAKGFYEEALCECESLSKSDLIAAAILGENEFFEYLKNVGFEGFVSALSKSTSAFEKYCDDRLMEIMKKAKMTAFGISPLAAYFFARETEIKCVRIILSAKFNGSSEDAVRERMRELYV
ncbi:MAG: V-type ATPase subunit [Oscillospiraceae bacterium]